VDRRPDKDQLVAEAKRLKKNGLTYNEIGGQLGVAYSTIWRWLNPDRQRKIEQRRRGYKREWDRADTHPCSSCGAPVSRKTERCRECFSSEGREDRLWRWERIKELWDAGLPLSRMARRLGTTDGTVSVEIAKCEHEFGQKLVPRRANWKGHRFKPGASPTAPSSKDGARARLNHAVRMGKLKRPDECERCGADSRLVEAHHADYSRPLDVEWLCPACHSAEHNPQLQEAA
jgi:transcriptional regulator with XRE-family HTH domain